jgi:hypothetical protein
MEVPAEHKRTYNANGFLIFNKAKITKHWLQYSDKGYSCRCICSQCPFSTINLKVLIGVRTSFA